MDELAHLAELIKLRNSIEIEITALIGRPAQIGHIGEFIASRIFQIKLEESASHRAIDGYFEAGLLASRSVNIKWYAMKEGLLDITPDHIPDFYLVMTGPASAAGHSRGSVRPWTIHSVYLFEAQPLTERLRGQGIRIGIATSLRQKYWEEAEIFPEQRNLKLLLSKEEREFLRLFQ